MGIFLLCTWPVFFSPRRQCNGSTPQHTELPEGKTQVLQVHGPRNRMEVRILTLAKSWINLSTIKSFFHFVVLSASRADKSGTWNLPESQWLVRSKGRLAVTSLEVDDSLLRHIKKKTMLKHIRFLNVPKPRLLTSSIYLPLTSCLLDVRWRKWTLWSRPARWQTWSSSATKNSMIRATSTTKKTLPQRWASAKARYATTAQEHWW